MPIIKKHLGVVTRGKIIFESPEEFTANVRSHEGKKVVITVEQPTQKRSKSQNSYYWGVVVEMISNYTGHTPDEVHEAMKLMFLKIPASSEFPESVKNSSDLNTAEFVKFTDDVRRWAAAALGLSIPDPNECEW